MAWYNARRLVLMTKVGLWLGVAASVIMGLLVADSSGPLAVVCIIGGLILSYWWYVSMLTKIQIKQTLDDFSAKFGTTAEQQK